MASTKALERVYLNPTKDVIELPDLLENQKQSFNWFINEGLDELFAEIDEIEDYTGTKLTLSFTGFSFEPPRISDHEAKHNNTNYEATLHGDVRLVNKVTGEVKEQKIYLGDFPWMTERGTFVINGAERTVVSQLIRSPGVFFTADNSGDRNVYGAKVIPMRGAWLEFETGANGVLYVKVDRRRKMPVTTLLRAFGAGTNEEIQEMLGDLDEYSQHMLQETLKKDPAKTTADALLEVYRRMRPGDLATVDNAKGLLENTFFNFKRFDFSRVGRYKLNKRLGFDLPITVENRVLRVEDVVAIVREILRLTSEQGEPDEIDSFANRRVKMVGELMQRQFRIGLLRMERNTKDHMSVHDIETVTPQQLVNARPLVASVREFFASSQLSQFMDQVNPLSELTHKRRLNAMGPGGLSRERAGVEVRDVHRTHYGRACVVETPEGPNIGLVLTMACYARVNEYGFIETPYRKVINTVAVDQAEGFRARNDLKDQSGSVIVAARELIKKADIAKLKKAGLETVPVRARITEEVEYLDAADEISINIAQAQADVDEENHFVEDRIPVRRNGRPSEGLADTVDYMDISTKQTIGASASLIPFLEKDYITRALTGANQQRQAVPLIKPQAPIVGTGMESAVARNTGQLLVAEDSGEVEMATAQSVRVNYKKLGRKTYDLLTFERSNEGTTIHQRVAVSRGDKINKGDILANGMSVDRGELAVGANLLVAYTPWGGYNFEDAIVISERLVQEDVMTSIHIEDYNIDVRETKLGPEITTSDMPNVSEDALKDLDEEGIIRVGAEVHPGDILVGKLSPRGEQELSSEERLLRAIFGEKAKDVRDTSLRMPNGKHGKVVGVKIFSREQGHDLKAGTILQIQVHVATMRKIQVGDKLAGRHGNKGVIARVLPQADMPFTEDGTPVDIVLNPLGVAQRMNMGQIFETHLGWAAEMLGMHVASPAFDGVGIDQVKELLKKAGLPEDGKAQLYDGRTGEAFKERATIGFSYVNKLVHMVDDKIHARSTGPYTMVTQQPLGGKAQNGGQRFGEMEVWALEAYGAANILQEMLTIKSDDVIGRSKAYESIIKGEDIHGPRLPESFNVLVKELQGLGLEVDLVQDEKTIDAEEVLEEGIQEEVDDLGSAKLIEGEAEQVTAKIPPPQDDTSDEENTEPSDADEQAAASDVDEEKANA